MFLTVTVPVNKMFLAVTVPVNKTFLTVTVPVSAKTQVAPTGQAVRSTDWG